LVLIEAPSTNGGAIYIGTSSAVILASNYHSLDPGEALEICVEDSLTDDDKARFDLTDLWMDGATTGDKLTVSYFLQTARQLT